MPEVKIENYNGSPAIMINGVPYPPMLATIRTNKYTHVEVDGNYYKELGKRGIKIFFLICDTEWLKPGAYEQFLEEAEILIREVPDAYIMLRIGMHPPVSWCKENPGETLTYSDGKKKGVFLYTESFSSDYPDGIYSFSSKKWQEDAGKALEETYFKIRNSKFKERVIGCFFAAGGTSEWYYLSPTEYTAKTNYTDSGGWIQTRDTDYENVYADLSPAFKMEFSAYLKEKYKTDENLQKAWKDNEVTIKEPKICDCDGRYFIYGVDYDLKYPSTVWSSVPNPPIPTNGTNIGSFIDIDKREDVFDFFRALHLGTANAVIYFGNLVKKLNPNMLTGAFYGSAGATKFFGFSQIGGVDKILKSGVIDFLASPGVYENRGAGGFTGQRQNFDSFRLKNTMFVVEDDVRTHLENTKFRNDYEIYNITQTYNVMKREFGRNICQDTQSWWFDQHIGGGRYKHPEIYKLIEKQQKIAKEAYEKDRRKNSEIALIYDEESYHVISDESNQQLIEIFRNYDVDIIGAPTDRYLHNDMEYENMPDYKLYIFCNTLYLSDEERKNIKKKLAKNNATALFMYASGIINPDRDMKFDVQNVSDFTGIKMERIDEVFFGRFEIKGKHKIAKGLEENTTYGDFNRLMRYNGSGYNGKVREMRPILMPLIYADDSEAENIGYFLDSEKPALSIKKNDGFTSIYCGCKYISNEVVREIARFAGCHIYSETNDVLYVNKNYLVLHSAANGLKTIKLPQKKSAFEVYEERYYSKESKEIKFESKRGETKMFLLEE